MPWKRVICSLQYKDHCWMESSNKNIWDPTLKKANMKEPGNKYHANHAFSFTQPETSSNKARPCPTVAHFSLEHAMLAWEIISRASYLTKNVTIPDYSTRWIISCHAASCILCGHTSIVKLEFITITERKVQRKHICLCHGKQPISTSFHIDIITQILLPICDILFTCRR